MAMTALEEPAASAIPAGLAPAKVNLSLRILGRRSDGYHELESLVAFGRHGAADRVSLSPGGPLKLEIEGAGARKLAGESSNLILRAADAALTIEPRLTLGTFRLVKHLPIAAGLGGGSANAAAALRLIRDANPHLAKGIDWSALAVSIGADVPVCLMSRASLMTGIGERLQPLAGFPPVWAVLANPGQPLETRAVFNALSAPPLAKVPGVASPPRFPDLDALIDALAGQPNDLQPAATQLCPIVATVCAALVRLDGALLVRMSGSGPTCFALFAAAAPAEAGAAELRSAEPGWWVEPVALG